MLSVEAVIYTQHLDLGKQPFPNLDIENLKLSYNLELSTYYELLRLVFWRCKLVKVAIHVNCKLNSVLKASVRKTFFSGKILKI